MAERRVSSAPKTATTQPPPWQRPPQWWGGGSAQWAVYWAMLVEFGQRSEGLRWFFQSLYAPGTMLGYGTLDFWIPDAYLGIRVLPAHIDPQQQAREQFQFLQLSSMGITVVDIANDDALRAPLPMVRDALRGISHVRQG